MHLNASRRRRTALRRTVAAFAAALVAATGVAALPAGANRSVSEVSQTQVDSCTVRPVKDENAVPIAVIVEPLKEKDDGPDGDDSGESQADRINELIIGLRMHYVSVTVYEYDDEKDTISNRSDKGASSSSKKLESLQGHVVLNYAKGADKPNNSSLVHWYTDTESRAFFSLVDQSQQGGSPLIESVDDPEIYFETSGDTSKLHLTTSKFPTGWDVPKGKSVPVLIDGVTVKLGGMTCELQGSGPSSETTTMSGSNTTIDGGEPGDVKLILPAELTWKGGSGIQDLRIEKGSSNLVAPMVDLGNSHGDPSITTPSDPEDEEVEDSKGIVDAIATTGGDEEQGMSGGMPWPVGALIGLILGGVAVGLIMNAQAKRARGHAGSPLPLGLATAAAAGGPGGFGPSAGPVGDGWNGPTVSGGGGGAAAGPSAAAEVGRSKRNGTSSRAWTMAVPGGAAVRLDDVGSDRLMPRTTDHGRVWAMGRSDVAATAGWFEKRRGKGEDAEPTLRIHRSGRGIIGVYDGTGGSGATVARTTGDGTELSGAWVASRLVRDTVEAWFTNAVESGDRALETAGLTATLQRVLTDEAEHLPAARTTVRGTLHRVLPTTAACLAFDASTHGGTVDALWAGDSRAFVLTPAKGLQVLTRDDTREDDALELIRNDQPMENLIAADRPFRVNHRRFDVPAPAVFVTATDGAFGYVRTPAHFEYLLLHALAEADTMHAWSARLLELFAEFAADDVSFSMAAIGFASFADLKAQFTARRDYLASEHWKPFVDNTGDAEAIERLRTDSWVVYKDLHVERLAEPDAAVPADQRPAGQ